MARVDLTSETVFDSMPFSAKARSVRYTCTGAKQPTTRAAIRDRLARGVTDGDLTAPAAGLDAIARYYTTVVQGLSLQARDGATRAESEAVITCAMAAWDALTSGTRPRGSERETG